MARYWLAAALWMAVPRLSAADNVQYARLERERILNRLRKVTAGDAERLRTVRRLFEEAGCRAPALYELPVAGAELPNLICRLNGESGQTIVVGAHYDAAPSSLGAADNWSGASLLPSLYQSLRDTKRRYNFLFVAFTGGLDGRRGSRQYVKLLGKAEANNIRAMVDIESIGLTRPMAWEYGSGRALVGAMRSIASAVMLPVDIEEPYKLGRTDAESFLRRGIPAITIHSVSRFNHQLREGASDTLAVIKEDEYYETYMLTASYLAYLDLQLP